MKSKKIDEQTFTFLMTGNQERNLILEFYVCNTNELNPYREIKELGIVLYDENEDLRKSDDYIQLDSCDSFGVDEIDNLIKYLQKVKKHIKQFNETSQPC